MKIDLANLTMLQARAILIRLLLPLLAAGCATVPSPDARRASAEALAGSLGWTLQAIEARPFALAAFMPPAAAAGDGRLAIYLEGDGMAWISPSRISDDPTPADPLALRLALAQPTGAAAYVGRPCQYISTPSVCETSLWTSRRFAPEVISATGRAIDLLKERMNASQITLVGYSGGAAVAMLVAARRTDVVRVVTVAGNLDHRAWTRLHRIDPLRGSLNPADDGATDQRFSQWHFSGEKDDIIPPRLARDFVARHGDARSTVRVMPGFNHHCCWAQAWPRLWNEVTSYP